VQISDFEILAFPCNQFLSQEPGSSEDVKEFACTRFKAEYPVFQKVKILSGCKKFKHLKRNLFSLIAIVPSHLLSFLC
jgi:glutathione peroxidase-family protein